MNTLPVRVEPVIERNTMKRITVMQAESGRHQDFDVRPGTTARDVLSQMGLDDQYRLWVGNRPEPLTADENVYTAVQDGGKMLASTPVEVGGSLLDSPLFKRLIERSIEKVESADLIDAPNLFLRPNIPIVKQAGFGPAMTRPRKAQLVARDERPLWAQRGWVWFSHEYHGYYRIQSGDSWRGKATVSPSGRIDLYIHKPPREMRNHPNWHCFFEHQKGWYFIHNDGVEDLSSGILEVERILWEAHES